MEPAFDYIKAKGTSSEQSYPYEGKDGKCNEMATKLNNLKCTGFRKIKPGNCDDLRDAVANVGPISVAMDTRQLKMDYDPYKIYHPHECSSVRKDLDHTVLVVGYGSEGWTDYWLVKNSWGPEWGLDGYFKIASDNNLCGICTDAVFPVVA